MKMKKCLAFILVLLIISMSFSPSISADGPSLPHIHVFTSYQKIGLDDSGIPNTNMTITLYDSLSNVKYSQSFLYTGIIEDNFDVGIPIIAGDRIELSDGTLTREVLIQESSIPEIDQDNDKVTGLIHSSYPVSSIRVGIWKQNYNAITNMYEEYQTFRYASVDNGTWSADFSIAQGDQLPYNIVGDEEVSAFIFDSDFDFQEVFIPNLPNMFLYPDRNYLDLNANGNFSGPLTLTLYDSENVVKDTLVANYIMQAPLTKLYFQNDIKIETGDRITLTYGSRFRDMSIISLTVTAADISSDTISGETNAPGPLLISIMDDIEMGSSSNMRLVNVVDGHWVADFSIASEDCPIYDLKPGDVVWMSYRGGGWSSDGVFRELQIPAYLYGDVNNDNIVNRSDAVLIHKYLAGRIAFDDRQLVVADYDRNVVINVNDSKMIMKLKSK